MNKNKLRGILFIALGVFVLAWTYQHRPSEALVNKINGIFDDSSYSMSDTWYYICLAAGAVITALGFRSLIK
ncbi:MAG: hypothetical protein ACJAT1_001963 [Marivirga sp.]|jgi:hypothetical protein